MKAFSEEDPRGLIGEAYRIDGIGPGECRTIFLDWALSLPEGTDQRKALAALFSRHGEEAPDHPMSAVLQEALQAPPPPGRRGGRRARR